MCLAIVSSSDSKNIDTIPTVGSTRGPRSQPKTKHNVRLGRNHGRRRLPMDTTAPGAAQYRRGCIRPIGITLYVICSLITLKLILIY